MKVKIVNIRRILTIIVMVLVLYCLSTGPVYLALRKGKVSRETFSSAYSPILTASRQYRFCNQVFHAYLKLWYSDPQAANDWLDGLLNSRRTIGEP